MEIRQIISYSVDKQKNILEVSFKTIDDSEEESRFDSIDYNLTKEYGFELETESFDFFEFDEDDDSNIDEIELDEDELINFLNEYYTINPQYFPKSDFF